MNTCLQCNLPTKNKKFCSHSCSATYINSRRFSKNTCRNCGVIIRKHAKFCSHKCHSDYVLNQKIISGQVLSGRSVKKYMINKIGYYCHICKLTSWLNNPISLELHHIDGDSTNNSISNLQLLCPNCHSQTNTYKAKNKGRATRRNR